MSAAPVGKWLLAGAAVAIAAAVACAIAVMGSPAEQREIRVDRHRVRDLAQIAGLVRIHAERHGQPPADLKALARQPGIRLAIADPVDGKPYDYSTSGKDGFRLCAHFTTDTAESGEIDWGDGHWEHPAGKHCFDLKVKEGGHTDPGGP